LIDREPSFGSSSKIEDDLNEVSYIFMRLKCSGDFVREYIDECLKVVDDMCGGIYQFELLLFVICRF
jgi:hypothetical protein